jgi:hypothetical protein
MSQSPEPKLPAGKGGYTSQALDILGREILNPAASWTPFWKPRFVAASPALVHLPFLFWLMENHAPQRVVQLGVGDGVAYLALCQAVDKLGLNAACRGISLFGGQEANPEAAAHNAKMYEDFSVLSTEELATANRHYRKGGIDLLVINTPLGADIAGVLADKWNRLMSDRGLIVVLDSTAKMTEEGAKVWLTPLLDTCPAIELEQGEGLLALTVGPDQDGRISRLADLELGMAGYREARQVFQTLGDRIVAGHSAEELQAALEVKSSSLTDSQNQLSHIQQELAKARAAEDNANEELARVQARSFDLENERSELAAKLAEAARARRELDEQLSAERERHSAELAAKIAETQTVEADLQKSQTARAELETKLAEAEAAASNLEESLAKAREAEEQTAILAAQQADAARIEHEKIIALVEHRLAESEAALARMDRAHRELEAQLSAEQERHSIELVAKNDALSNSSEKYRARLADIAELGRIIRAKDEEVARLRSQNEESDRERIELQQKLSTEQDHHSAELAAKLKELERSKTEYRERLADIAELGHILSSKDKELTQLRAQHEEDEIRYRVLAQLAKTKAELKQAEKPKLRLRPDRRANNAIAEDIRLVEASDHFDADWYLAFYPDVAAAGADPAHHFVTEGAYELRNPGPGFDSLKYHKAYPDVTAEGLAGFIHYIRHGRAENRETFPVGERR